MNGQSPIRTEALLAEADWLHRLARAMLRDEGAAHDVAQDALVAALGQAGTPVANVRAWLQSIVHRLAARRRRTESRRLQREQQRAVPEGDEREAATAERLRLHRRLCDAVLELPEPYRTAVSLRFFDDLPPRVIARQCGVSAGVVRQRLHRGLCMLRTRFDAESGGRGEWVRSFGAAGFGVATTTTSLPVLLPLFAMKKFVVAVVVLVVAGVAWWSGRAAPSALPTVAEVSSVVATAASGTGLDAAALKAASARTAVNDAFVVCVLDAQDRPVVAASVHRWRADGEVEVVRTNERGIAAFAPRPEAGGVLVRGRGLQNLVQVLSNLRGDVTVRVGVGRVVGGRMFEDGAPVSAGLELKLSVPSRHDDLPDAPDAILDLLTAERCELTAVTDGRGDFAFAGLADDWAGELQVPITHWLLRQPGQLVAADDRLLVLAPDSGLRVETTRLPTLRGRVEWSDGSGPVADAFVMIGNVTFADGATGQAGCKSDEQGRFAVGLRPGASNQRDRWLDPGRRSEPVRIEISACRAASANRVLEAGGGPLDLRQEIVLRLDPPARRRFRAVDPEGLPIVGARALQGDGVLSEPTGDDGVGEAMSPFGLWVGASGRQVASVRQVTPLATSAPATGSEMPDVVLVPGSELQVCVRRAVGEVAAPHAVELVGVGRDLQAANLRRWLGESPTDLAGRLHCDGRGEARILALPPNVTCRLVVRDHFGGELAVQDVITPPAGASRRLDIELPAARLIGRGRVLDANGAPVAVATVQLRAGFAKPGQTEPAGLLERTAADGTFRFAPVHATNDLVLTAHRVGFAAMERVVTVAEFAGELTITLAPAQRTTIRIVDEDGVPVPEPMLVVEAGTSRRVDQQMVGPGEHVCLDLPPGEVTFACWVAGKRHELRHDTSKPQAELRVPRCARVRCERPAGWQASASGRRLIARATRLDAVTEPVSMELDDDARGVPQLLLPGRYRLALAEMWWNYEQKRIDTELLGPAAEVDLRTGEVAHVTLR